jgi:tRNA (guanine37-N1)-methyltransferase
VYRLIDGVISRESLKEESYADGLLEYPQYTRPEVFRNLSVPEVLLSGHHENVRKWRLKERLKKTLAFRPDLLDEAARSGNISAEAQKLLEELQNE